MLDAIVELINLGASSSLQVFCFCNLIIVILLVSNWKPSSASSDDYQSSNYGSRSSTMTQKFLKEQREEKGEEKEVEKQTQHYHQYQQKEEASLSIDIEVSSSNFSTLPNSNDPAVDESGDHNGHHEEEDEDEDEDELRKRIEEFIEKVNRGWRAEKLGSTNYV